MEEKARVETSSDWKMFLGYSGVILSGVLGTLSGLTFMFHWVQIVVYGAPLGTHEDLSGNMLFTYIFVYLVNLFPVAMLSLALFYVARSCGRQLYKTGLRIRRIYVRISRTIVVILLLIALGLVFIMVSIAVHVRGLLWVTKPSADSLAFLPLVLNIFRGERILVLSAPVLLCLYCLYALCRQVKAIRLEQQPVPHIYMFIMTFMFVLSLLGYLYLQGVMFPDIGLRNAARVQVTTYVPLPGRPAMLHNGYLVGQNAAFLSLFPTHDHVMHAGGLHSTAEQETLFVAAQHTVENVVYLGYSLQVRKLIGRRLESETSLDVMHMPVEIVIGKIRLPVWLWAISIYGILFVAWQIRAVSGPLKESSPDVRSGEDKT